DNTTADIVCAHLKSSEAMALRASVCLSLCLLFRHCVLDVLPKSHPLCHILSLLLSSLTSLFSLHLSPYSISRIEAIITHIKSLSCGSSDPIDVRNSVKQLPVVQDLFERFIGPVISLSHSDPHIPFLLMIFSAVSSAICRMGSRVPTGFMHSDLAFGEYGNDEEEVFICSSSHFAAMSTTALCSLSVSTPVFLGNVALSCLMRMCLNHRLYNPQHTLEYMDSTPDIVCSKCIQKDIFQSDTQRGKSSESGAEELLFLCMLFSEELIWGRQPEQPKPHSHAQVTSPPNTYEACSTRKSRDLFIFSLLSHTLSIFSMKVPAIVEHVGAVLDACVMVALSKMLSVKKPKHEYQMKDQPMNIPLPAFISSSIVSFHLSPYLYSLEVSYGAITGFLSLCDGLPTRQELYGACVRFLFRIQSISNMTLVPPPLIFDPHTHIRPTNIKSPLVSGPDAITLPGPPPLHFPPLLVAHTQGEMEARKGVITTGEVRQSTLQEHVRAMVPVMCCIWGSIENAGCFLFAGIQIAPSLSTHSIHMLLHLIELIKCKIRAQTMIRRILDTTAAALGFGGIRPSFFPAALSSSPSAHDFVLKSLVESMTYYSSKLSFSKTKIASHRRMNDISVDTSGYTLRNDLAASHLDFSSDYSYLLPYRPLNGDFITFVVGILFSDTFNPKLHDTPRRNISPVSGSTGKLRADQIRRGLDNIWNLARGEQFGVPPPPSLLFVWELLLKFLGGSDIGDCIILSVLRPFITFLGPKAIIPPSHWPSMRNMLVQFGTTEDTPVQGVLYAIDENQKKEVDMRCRAAKRRKPFDRR
ncbi:hypothetical protein ADUPG1_008398, partial [Aduncisulcus paluster]